MSDLPTSKTIMQLRAVQGGDRAALDDVLGRYLPRLRKAVAIMLGRSSANDADVDDTVQEVLMAAVRGIDGFEPRTDATFMSWLMTIAVNKLRDQQRHALRKKRGAGAVKNLADIATSTGGALSVPSPDPSVSQMVRTKEIEEAEMAALTSLSPRHREMIVDHDVLGLSYEEMAKKHGYQTPDPPRALHSRARRKLSQLLRRFDDHGDTKKI